MIFNGIVGGGGLKSSQKPVRKDYRVVTDPVIFIGNERKR
jgi:hypothetical protein